MVLRTQGDGYLSHRKFFFLGYNLLPYVKELVVILINITNNKKKIIIFNKIKGLSVVPLHPKGWSFPTIELYENDGYVSNDQRCYQLAEDLLQVMEPMSLIAKLGSRMGFFAMRKYLEGIARIEMPDNYGQDEEL